jgi:hypothetical protein
MYRVWLRGNCGASLCPADDGVRPYVGVEFAEKSVANRFNR